MPRESFSEIVRHDANTALNEFVSYSIVWYLVEYLKIEGMVFSASDDQIVTALKSAGLTVSINEVLRAARRMGWTISLFR